jgi:F-box interacting protein
MNVPKELLRAILVKLPTRDVARCCYVCRLWRAVVSKPSFRDLHAANHTVDSADAELLLVSERRVPGWTDEASVFNVSSGKPMLPVTIPRGYSLANVCNGFLCFFHGDEAKAPTVVCNPVTGEKLTLPRDAPAPGDHLSHLVALGFSPCTHEYKLFRFSFCPDNSYPGNRVHVHVQTLGATGGGGGRGGWRHHFYLSVARPIRYNPPLYIDGKLYLVNTGSAQSDYRRIADRMLVLDVATETRRMYRLPYPKAQARHWNPLVDAFEMNGKLCLAVNVLLGHYGRNIQFWVMSPPPDEQHLHVKDEEDDGYDDDHDSDDYKLYWDLRYSFHVDDRYSDFQMTAAWLDGGGMLCYRHGDTLYKYDTRIHSASPDPMADYCPPYDHKLQLPATAPSSFKCEQDTREYRPFITCQWDMSWDIYCGYRPTLLSPLALSPPPRQDDYDEDHSSGDKIEQDLLSVVRCHQ